MVCVHVWSPAYVVCVHVYSHESRMGGLAYVCMATLGMNGIGMNGLVSIYWINFPKWQHWNLPPDILTICEFICELVWMWVQDHVEDVIWTRVCSLTGWLILHCVGVRAMMRAPWLNIPPEYLIDILIAPPVLRYAGYLRWELFNVWAGSLTVYSPTSERFPKAPQGSNPRWLNWPTRRGSDTP